MSSVREIAVRNGDMPKHTVKELAGLSAWQDETVELGEAMTALIESRLRGDWTTGLIDRIAAVQADGWREDAHGTWVRAETHA